MLINNGTHQRETLTEWPIRLSLKAHWLQNLQIMHPKNTDIWTWHKYLLAYNTADLKTHERILCTLQMICNQS